MKPLLFISIHVALLLLLLATGVRAQTSVFPLNPDKLEYAQEVTTKAKATQDSSLLAEAEYMYGKLFSLAGDYPSSQRKFLHSLRIQEALHDTVKIIRLYTWLGDNERQQGHYEQAAKYVQKALNLSLFVPNVKRTTHANLVMGHIFEGLWESDKNKGKALFDSAYQYFRHAEDVMETPFDTVGMGETYLALGSLLLKNSDPTAINYLQNALLLHKAKSQVHPTIKSMIQLAAAYLQLGSPSKALELLTDAQRYYHDKRVDNYTLLLQIKSGLANYYKITGNLSKALEHTEELLALERKQFTNDRTGTLERLQKEYASQQAEKELEIKNDQLKLQRRHNLLQKAVILFMAGLMVVAATTSYFFYNLYRRNKRLRLLNAQLVDEQSHRVKNHLQMAVNLLRLQGRALSAEAAHDVIEKSQLQVQAIGLLQKQLYRKKGGSEIELPGYIDQLVQSALKACGYSHIAQTVHTDSVSLDPDRALPIALILTELITNACKYAFPNHANPHIMVSCTLQRTNLQLQVSDNGQGIKPSSDPTGESLGMRLIRMQAEQLYATYDISHVNGKGTTFRMNFGI